MKNPYWLTWLLNCVCVYDMLLTMESKENCILCRGQMIQLTKQSLEMAVTIFYSLIYKLISLIFRDGQLFSNVF